MVVHTFGDLLKAKEQLIVHGCNCFHTMGSGVAKQIKRKYPEAYEADKQTPYGSKEKLGSWSHHTLPSGQRIINLYTQFRYGTDKQHFDFDAFRKGIIDLGRTYPEIKDIAMPRIGAGLGGANWLDIENTLNDINSTVDPEFKKHYIIYNI